MTTRIYQRAVDKKDDGRMHKWLNKIRHTVFPKPDETEYTQVFCGELEQSNPQTVFDEMNTSPHPLFFGHQLGNGDVISIDSQTLQMRAGRFVPVAFSAKRVREEYPTLRTVFVEPDIPAYETRIPDGTLLYQALRHGVNGHIDPVYLTDDVCIIANAAGLLDDLPPNRIWKGHIIFGNFFVLGLKNRSFRDLSDKEISEWTDMFRDPSFVIPEPETAKQVPKCPPEAILAPA